MGYSSGMRSLCTANSASRAQQVVAPLERLCAQTVHIDGDALTVTKHVPAGHDDWIEERAA